MQLSSSNTILEGVAEGQSAFARLVIHDVSSGDEWRLQIEALDINYTLNRVPRAQFRIPIGYPVAEALPNVDGGLEFVETVLDDPAATLPSRISLSQTFPNNAGFYELKAMVDLDGNGNFDACLFRGYATEISVLDARSTPSGRREAKISGKGSAGFLQEQVLDGQDARQSMSAGGASFGQNSLGETNNAGATSTGNGTQSIPDLIQDALIRVCDENMSISGVQHSASKAKWVLANMLNTSNWYFNATSAKAAYQVGEVMMSLLTRSSTDMWMTMLGIAQYFNLGIISKVNELLMVPMVRPFSQHDMTLDGDEVKSYAVSNRSERKVRGVRLIQDEKTFTHDASASRDHVPRVLAYLYYRYATGAMEKLNARRWPWLVHMNNPAARARALCKQLVIDRVFGVTELAVNVPWIDDVMPGSVVKVLNVHAFDDTGSTIWGTQTYEAVDVFGTVKSVRLHMDSRNPEVSTSIVLSHVMDENSYARDAMTASDHMIADRVFSNIRGDYNTWDDYSIWGGDAFSPSGSDYEYPESEVWSV